MDCIFSASHVSNIKQISTLFVLNSAWSADAASSSANFQTSGCNSGDGWNRFQSFLFIKLPIELNSRFGRLYDFRCIASLFRVVILPSIRLVIMRTPRLFLVWAYFHSATIFSSKHILGKNFPPSTKDLEANAMEIVPLCLLWIAEILVRKAVTRWIYSLHDKKKIEIY